MAEPRGHRGGTDPLLNTKFSRLRFLPCTEVLSKFFSTGVSTGIVVLIIIKKTVYKLLKRGKIRELLTKFTIVNAEDSLFQIWKKSRAIVEFPGEGLGTVRYVYGYRCARF
jgi:hypothetical protein